MEAKIEVNNKQFQVLQTILVSWTDIHQASTEAMQEKRLYCGFYIIIIVTVCIYNGYYNFFASHVSLEGQNKIHN
jgi:hypothetical protein